MATFALLIWIPIAVLIFAAQPALTALIWATVLPYLFLPEAFAIELPGLPDIDKTASISLGLILGYVFYGRKFAEIDRQYPTVVGNPRAGLLIRICLVLIVVGIALTILNNREALQFGPRRIQGLRLWDAIGMIGQLVFLITPFLFARRYLATPDAQRRLLIAFVLTGLGYSLLMLIELRFSPQIHNWIYGYHQHSFLQHVRDGYRPKVFLQHGLWVGFFIFMAAIAAAALWRETLYRKWLLATIWLLVILAASKNLGATLICILMFATFFGLKITLRMRVLMTLAVAVLLYPALRQAKFIPIDTIINAAAIISEDRAKSLEFRVEHENKSLARAYLKPLSGWGIYARDRVRDEQGRDTTVADGYWIIVIGTRGWLGYIALFGLLTIPLVLLPRTQHRKNIPPVTIGLALIAGGNLVYMIPNATLTPVGLLVFGALAGFVQQDTAAIKQDIKSERPSATKRRQPRYSRATTT